MPTDRSLESLRAEVEQLRARFARMRAEDRNRRRAWQREPPTPDVERRRPGARLTPGSSA
jgi:hypothetical protein